MNRYNRVIVIGASAGGVDALLRIVPALGKDFPAPVLIVLHIGTHHSILPKLLNTKGANRAMFAETGMLPRPGEIYVAPPDRHLLLESGVLQLHRGPKEHHTRPAIDPLFRSAALDYGPRAVGVVLTGMMDDGTAGLQAIKACGGVAVVQDPNEAREPEMPRSAIAHVPVDHVTKIDAMADLLNSLAQAVDTRESVQAPEWLRIERAISLGRANMQELTTIANPSAFTCPDCGGALFEFKERYPVRFICHTGHAFSLSSLVTAQTELTDEALWTMIRALQEKEALLRRVAESPPAESAGSASTALAEADKLAAFIGTMRAGLSNMPG
jgi:two-component system, chemotaxis family, protein-glutamate methylesterase/glutaminase